MWRFLRNLFILLLAIGLSLYASAWLHVSILHWLWVAPLYYLTYLVWQAFLTVHPFRFRYLAPARPEYASLDYEKVLFKSSDGLSLFGWYLPGNNRSALILIHGLGSYSLDLVFHAKPLVRAGYGVFLIDLRAHASSDGKLSTMGFLEANDVAGAVDYLLTRQDVDADKIGALGISLGAEAALRGALKTDALRALVMEGLGPVKLSDHGPKQKSWRARMMYSINRLSYLLFELMSGVQAQGVLEVIGQVAPRPIMLIACGKNETRFNRLFYAAAHEPKTLWELPKARHAGGLAQESEEYPRRVIAFFDQTMGIKRE